MIIITLTTGAALFPTNSSRIHCWGEALPLMCHQKFAIVGQCHGKTIRIE